VVSAPNRIEPTSELWLACRSGYSDRALLKVIEVGLQGQVSKLFWVGKIFFE